MDVSGWAAAPAEARDPTVDAVTMLAAPRRTLRREVTAPVAVTLRNIFSLLRGVLGRVDWVHHQTNHLCVPAPGLASGCSRLKTTLDATHVLVAQSADRAQAESRYCHESQVVGRLTDRRHALTAHCCPLARTLRPTGQHSFLQSTTGPKLLLES